MRTTSPKASAQAARAFIAIAISGLLWFFLPGQASAGFCSSTSCNLALTNSNFIGTGKFGTVSLTLSANVVTIDVNLASPHRIVKTGFPGAAGVADNNGGGLTMGDLRTGGTSTSLYSGYGSPDPGCTVKDCQWAAFGYANNAAAASGPQRPLSLQELSFTVSKGTSITNVRQLLQQFASNGRSAHYFTVDGCVWRPTRRACGGPGPFAVTRVP